MLTLFVKEVFEKSGVEKLFRFRQTNDRPYIARSMAGHGYCEGCQRHKPAPKQRRKGWRCQDCRTTTSK